MVYSHNGGKTKGCLIEHRYKKRCFQEYMETPFFCFSISKNDGIISFALLFSRSWRGNRDETVCYLLAQSMLLPEAVATW